MNTLSNLTYANIDNLTSLWETVSEPFHAIQNRSLFGYSEIRHSDWPNRLWFNRDADITPESTAKAREIISSNSTKLSLIYWDIFNSQSWRYAELTGFSKEYELMAMSLKLGEPFGHQNRLKLKRVERPHEILIWEELYPQSFGYRIGRNVLENSLNKVTYYLAFYNGQPAGTAIIFHTGKIAGIHGVGIVPEMRRKGFAEEMMKMILNKSIQSGYTYATLQSSVMGKGMYLKLGFEELFTMKSFCLDSCC